MASLVKASDGDADQDVYTKLWNAWSARDGDKFYESWKNVKNTQFVENLCLNLNMDFTHASYYFAKVIFENNSHRGIFLTGKTLAQRVLDHGNWPILDLLLQYYTNLRKTDEFGNTLLHSLCKNDWHEFRKYFKKCLELLLANGEIDVNALNYDRNTALDLAIAVDNKDAVEVLLKLGDQLYLDGQYSGRLTTRRRLTRNYPEFEDRLPSFNTNVITVAGLTLLLKEKNESEFCPLFEQALLNNEINGLSPKWKHLLLQEACQNNLPRAVKLLLENGADASYCDNWNDFQSAVLIAIFNGHFKMVALLLNKTSIPDETAFAGTGRKFEFDINKQDAKGNTILHYAIFNYYEKAIIEVLKAGGSLAVENSKHQILSRIPVHIWQQYLDNKITSEKNQQFVDDKITFNYDFLTSTEQSKDSEIRLLNEISEVKELRTLLTHPVLSSFIQLKWQKLQSFFIINMTFHLLLILLLTFNILWVSVTGQEMLRETRAVQIYFIILLLLRLVFQASINFKGCCHQIETHIDLGIIATSGYLVIEECTVTDLCCVFAPTLLLLSWFRFLLLVAKHPKDWAPVKSALQFSISLLKCLLFGLFGISALWSITGTTEFIAISIPCLVSITALYCSEETQSGRFLTFKDALINLRITQIKYLMSIEEVLQEFQRFPIMKIFSNHLLKFSTKFSSDDCNDASTFFYRYKINRDIWKTAEKIKCVKR